MIVVRGNCTFTEKAAAVQAAGGAAMLLYDSQVGGCVTMGEPPCRGRRVLCRVCGARFLARHTRVMRHADSCHNVNHG